MDLYRGDIIICATSGDYGKPRPAVVIQNDLFNETHASISICPITSHTIKADLFRLSIKPSKNNGLKKHSQIMIDKITSIKRERITKVIGQLTEKQHHGLNDALSLWLDIFRD